MADDLDPDTAAEIRRLRAEADALSEDRVSALAARAEEEAGKDGTRMVLDEARRIAADAVRQAHQVTDLLGRLSALLGDDDPQDRS